MSYRIIKTDAIVRLSHNPGSKKDKAIENLPPFDEEAWDRLCERTYKHTLLTEEINKRIKRNPDLIKWIFAVQDIEVQDSLTTDTEQDKGWLPGGLVDKLCVALKDAPRFEKMSGRSRTSVVGQVKRTFNSWHACRQKLILKIKGKRRWLSVVESDFALAENSNFNLNEIKEKSEEILAQIKSENEADEDSSNHQLFNYFFKKHDATEDILSRRAIIHLLKNEDEIERQRNKPRKYKQRNKSRKHKLEKHKDQNQPAQPMSLAERLEAKRVEIERLEKQLLGQLPRARNLLPDKAFDKCLDDLIAMPEIDTAWCDRYLFFSLLLLDSGFSNYVQFGYYLLTGLELPEMDTVECDRSYFLFLPFLLLGSASKNYVQLRYYLLTELEFYWYKLSGLHYNRVLIYAFLLYATTEKQYLQWGQHLLRLIRVEAARVELDFFTWHDSVMPKQQEFLREPKFLPYPMNFGYDAVRAWQMNKEGKIFFQLNGWRDLTFEVRCNRRQLSLIKTFYNDWQTQNKNKGQYSGSLMLLCTIELIWVFKEANPKQSDTQLSLRREIPQQFLGSVFWDQCKLAVHWTFDSDALTQQGSEKIRQRKLEPQLEKLEKKRNELKQNQDLLRDLEAIPDSSRSKAQAKKIEDLRKQSRAIEADINKPRPKLECLQKAKLFDRPDRPLYEGIPNIFVGVLLDLDKHLVVTVVDAMRQKVLALRNAHSVSAEGYSLLQKCFRQRKEHSAQRQKDQIAHRHIQQTESGLGQQVARLFAQGLVKLAQELKASTIVLPETDGWRDRLYSQLVAKAEIKCNGYKEAMDRYTKEHGKRLHQWDYSRLSQAIVDCAALEGIQVIQYKTEFEADVFQQAANLIG